MRWVSFSLSVEACAAPGQATRGDLWLFGQYEIVNAANVGMKRKRESDLPHNRSAKRLQNVGDAHPLLPDGDVGGPGVSRPGSGSPPGRSIAASTAPLSCR